MYLPRAFFQSRPALLFCLLFFAFQAHAAVTVSNTSSQGAFNGTTGLATLSWSHQTPNGANKALFVGVSTATTNLPVGAPTNRVVSVTYGGTALTRVGTAISPDFRQTSEIFRLVNPPNGNRQIIVTFEVFPVGVGNPFVNYAVGGAVSFDGVSQTTPNGAFFAGSGNSSNPIVAVTDAVVGDIVLDTLAIAPGAGFAAVGANQTERWDGQGFFGNAFDVGAGSTEPGVGPVTTMSWTTTNPENWALGAVTVRQFLTSAASVTVSGRVLTAEGRPVRGARVTLTDANGETRLAVTSSFGYYTFENIAAGETYVAGVHSKRYSFAPRAVAVNDTLTDLDFVAEP
jgi:hypothetical protein